MNPSSSENLVNNPRMDLLRGGGDNAQYEAPEGPAPAPMANAPEVVTTPMSVEPSLDLSKLPPVPLAAAAKTEPPPVAETPPPEVPTPRPVPTPTGGGGPRKRRAGAIVLILIGLLLLAGAGVGGWWWFVGRNQNSQEPAPAPVAITAGEPVALEQQTTSGTTIEAGKSTNQTTIKFRFSVKTTANTGSLTPELELRPSSEAFTGQPTTSGTAVSASGSDLDLSIESSKLTAGSYHWQVRTSTGEQKSNWVVFGDGTTAFTIDITAPASPTVSSVGGKPVANPTLLSSGTPAFAGKTDPGNTITVTIGPDNQKLTATADSSGAWSATPSSALSNGQHSVSIVATDPAGNSSQPVTVALTVNAASATDTSPQPTASSAAPSTPAASPPATAAAEQPAASSTLAPTGDPITLPTVLALLSLLAGAVSLKRLSRSATR